VRGGIPLVFPQFGKTLDASMPQHGFLRNHTWTPSPATTASSRDFTLSLENVTEARGTEAWELGKSDLDCTATFRVTVGPDTLTTELIIENTGETNAFDFQTLFHTYYKIHGSKALDPTICNVTGLGGYHVDDKITDQTYVQSKDSSIIVDREVDRIYTPSEDDGPTELNVTVATGEGGGKVQVKAYGAVDDVTVPMSVVVWNPFIKIAKGMGDFGDDQYHDMICVEPGLLSNVPPLQTSKTAKFTQIITSL
jgi:glucose-6-phosphate 1-epimerase